MSGVGLEVGEIYKKVRIHNTLGTLPMDGDNKTSLISGNSESCAIDFYIIKGSY